MTSFVLIAAAMVLAVAALIARPLLSGGAVAPRSWWTASAVVVVLLAGAGGLYTKFSNWKWSPASQAADGSPESMVSTLARRLASNPDDFNGWLMLGRSYSVLAERAPEMKPLAVRAYERANQLGKGENVEALQGLAEALVSEDDNELAGRAGELIEKALTLAPQSPKLLFYGAVAAIQRKQLPLARERFASLLAENPPENVRGIIQQQINVKRLTAHFPQTVELSSSDAMLAGHGMQVGQDVEIVARISSSGGPLARSGDPFGSVAYHVGPKGFVNVAIDRLTP
jgi:cytochrome c-type biogenesis protein CcmH